MKRTTCNFLGFCITSLLLIFGQASLSAQDRDQRADAQQNLNNTPGALHNQGVLFVLEQIKSVPSPSEAGTVVTQLAKQFCAHAGLDCPSSHLIPVPFALNVEEAFRRIQGSDAFKDSLLLVVRLTANIRPNTAAAGLSLQQYETSLTDLETTASRNLRGNERTKFRHTVSIARMSALFWATTEEGGLNGSRIVQSPSDGTTDSCPIEIFVIYDILGYLLSGGDLLEAIIWSATSALIPLDTPIFGNLLISNP